MGEIAEYILGSHPPLCQTSFEIIEEGSDLAVYGCLHLFEQFREEAFFPWKTRHFKFLVAAEGKEALNFFCQGPFVMADDQKQIIPGGQQSAPVDNVKRGRKDGRIRFIDQNSLLCGLAVQKGKDMITDAQSHEDQMVPVTGQGLGVSLGFTKGVIAGMQQLFSSLSSVNQRQVTALTPKKFGSLRQGQNDLGRQIRSVSFQLFEVFGYLFHVSSAF